MVPLSAALVPCMPLTAVTTTLGPIGGTGQLIPTSVTYQVNKLLTVVFFLIKKNQAKNKFLHSLKEKGPINIQISALNHLKKH